MSFSRKLNLLRRTNYWISPKDCFFTIQEVTYLKFKRITDLNALTVFLNSTFQVLGLTASPGTNRADDGFSAVQHLKCLMANMDVSKLSVVRKYEQELLDYSSTPTKGLI